MIYANKTVQYAVYDRSSGTAKFVEDTTTLTRPSLENLTDTISGAGILGEIDMPTLAQLASMTYEIGLRRENPSAIKLFEQKTQELEIRWVTDTVDSATGNSAVSASKDIIKGRPKTLEQGTIENNAAQAGNLILEVLYFKHIQDGVTLIEIDKLNNVFIINGTDYAQQIRDAI